MSKRLVLFVFLFCLASVSFAVADTQFDACINEILKTAKDNFSKLQTYPDMPKDAMEHLNNGYKDMEADLNEVKRVINDPGVPESKKSKIRTLYQQSCPNTMGRYNITNLGTGSNTEVSDINSGEISEVVINGVKFKIANINGIKVYFINEDSANLHPFLRADECNVLRNACKSISVNYDMASPQQIKNLWATNKAVLLSAYGENQQTLPSIVTLDKSSNKLGQYTQIHEVKLSPVGKNNFIQSAALTDHTCYKPYFDANKPASISTTVNDKNKYVTICMPK